MFKVKEDNGYLFSGLCFFIRSISVADLQSLYPDIFKPHFLSMVLKHDQAVR